MTLSSSNHGKDIEDFLKEGTPAVVAFAQFGKNDSVLQKKNSAGVTGGKGIMRHHKNRRTKLFVDALDRRQKHLRRMTIQRTGWFICQKQFGIVDNCPGTRTTLLLAAGNLIGILVQNIRDIELLGNVLDTRLHISGGCFIDGKSQCNVFRNRQGIQQIKVLKHKAKILPAKPGNGLGLYLRNIRSSYNKIVVFMDRSPAECYNSFRVLWIGEALLPQRRFLGGSNHSFFVEMLIS